MAYNPCETWHPFPFDTDRKMTFIAKSDPAVLQPEQSSSLERFMFKKKKADFRYLHSHPEIKAIIIFVLSELVKHNPLYIKKFCSELFQHYKGDCLKQIINGILSRQPDDDNSSKSHTINSPSSSRTNSSDEKSNSIKCGAYRL